MRKSRLTAVILLLAFVLTLSPTAYGAAADLSGSTAEVWAAEALGVAQLASGNISRGEAAMLLSAAMDWPAAAGESAGFTDNDPAARHYQAVATLAAHGAVAAGGAFRPNDAVTRQELAVMLVGALGFADLGRQLKTADGGFADVSENAGYITFVRDLGLMSGVSATAFAPQDTVTYQQAAVIMARLRGLNAQKLERLHGFYAIASAGQRDLIPQLDSTSFGWSRLTLKDGAVTLNTTRQDGNAFYLPEGFAEPLRTAKTYGTAQLMVYADNVTAVDGGMLLDTVLASPQLRAQAVEAIVNHVNGTATGGQAVFDGVVIDFEAMKGEAIGANFIAFLRELDQALGAKTLYVAVHPVRSGQAYYDGYDYRAIGDIADQVILMASDYAARALTDGEMAMGYTMTPLSPLNEVYDGLRAITDPVTGVADRRKVWLQVSMDALQWKLVDNQVINRQPYHPTYEAVSQRLAQGVPVSYPNYSYNPYAAYHDETDGTDNILWYEDARSVAAKAQLARLFGLGGLSVWRLGNIPTETANALAIWQTLCAWTA